MEWIILAIIVGGGLLLGGSKIGSNSIPDIKASPITSDMGPIDIEPQDQGGSWTTKYDYYLGRGRDTNGIPFALMKAHAIRESALNSTAKRVEPSGKASYGLMQILWWPNSNRFKKYGYDDDTIGDGSLLFDPEVNCIIASYIIKENWNTYGNLRDTINAYNTGRAESVRVAPNNYTNDVIKYYTTLVGRSPV